MLNVFSLLPLLKGWSYKTTLYTRIVKKGAFEEVARVDELGALGALFLVTNDAYGGYTFTGQSADLNSYTLSNQYPKLYEEMAAYVQGPVGWASRYYRPNPASTAGIFVIAALTSGFQGTSFPYVPSTTLKLFLLGDSTQDSATVSVEVSRVVLTNKAQFIKSLRSVLGANVIQQIDPAILTPGATEITQKGWTEKGDWKQ